MKDKRFCIIGLGLIGGSLARALKERLEVMEITAVDPDSRALKQAQEDGIINRGFSDLPSDLLDCDVLVLATPVSKSLEYLAQLEGKLSGNCIVTDVSSTKGEILSRVEGLQHPPCFIGGHPMAGSEKSGYGAGSSHLFENAYYVLCPAAAATPQALAFMHRLVKGLGGIPIQMSASEHDRITGSISHLPHILAAALVNIVRESDTPEGMMRRLAAGGFRDITRIASSSPEMWESIVTSNDSCLMAILDSFSGSLEQFKEFMRSGRKEEIHRYFRTAKEYRDALISTPTGLVTSLRDIVVDVVDKPGIIGEIATLLGSSGINIKNIHVSNSREFEQGCLIITLPDRPAADRAFELLRTSGYKVYGYEQET